MNNNDFGLLRKKEILAILDGDTSFGEYEFPEDDKTIRISMPYLSGPDLCEISSLFGLPVTYPRSGGALSRWEYLDNLFAFCIRSNKVSELLSYLFDKNKFSSQLRGLSPDNIEQSYKMIVQKVLEQINSLLYFGGNELCNIDGTYYIRKIGSSISVKAPVVKVIDRTYIKDLSDRANKDIDESNFDSAITKARTILEETFCYVIEKKGVVPSSSGDIGKLYGQVKDLYNMHADKNLDKRINMLLSGLEKILSSIAEMRNTESDSHGVGSKRIGIADYHTRLFVNSSVAMADFILSVYLNSTK